MGVEIRMNRSQSLRSCVVALSDRFVGWQLLHLPVEMRPVACHKNDYAARTQQRQSCFDQRKLSIAVNMHCIVRVGCNQVSLHSARSVEHEEIQVRSPLAYLLKKARYLVGLCDVTAECKGFP